VQSLSLKYTLHPTILPITRKKSYYCTSSIDTRLPASSVTKGAVRRGPGRQGGLAWRIQDNNYRLAHFKMFEVFKNFKCLLETHQFSCSSAHHPLLKSKIKLTMILKMVSPKSTFIVQYLKKETLGKGIPAPTEKFIVTPLLPIDHMFTLLFIPNLLNYNLDEGQTWTQDREK